MNDSKTNKMMLKSISLTSIQTNDVPHEAVHLWVIDFNEMRATVDAMRQVLSQDEKRRADQFHFQIHRENFIIARAAMRHILASYLHVDTADLCFDHGKRGKPFLRDHQQLQFNLSHANNKAVLAITMDAAIGVDIEYVHREKDLLGIAERFFSDNEFLALKKLPEALQTRGFYNAWTRKEAFIKALGEGLFHSLTSFDVSLEPGELAQLLACRDPAYNVNDWFLTEINLFDDYVIALVREGEVQLIENYELVF